MTSLKLSDFDYHLPQERIAQSPIEPRDSSKLLTLCRQSGQMYDKIFHDITDVLSDHDVLVINETKVINARLKGYIWELDKKCEIFLHKQLSDNTWDCLVYPGKKLKVWTQVRLLSPDSKESEITATIIWISQKWRLVKFSQSGQRFLDTVEQIGETPLPPYIKEKNIDSSRYQTVYHDRQKSGSVAAPTAGLHFTPELLEKLEKKWVQIEKVCLHVGLWTFANVEVEDIQEHHMHSEHAYVSREVAQRLNIAKKKWKRIVAVGTTSVRTLESFSDDNWHIWHGTIDTEIFIYPGYQWRFVDSIITNFHLPKSTLLMLVSSFAWSESIKKAYRHAIDSEYRFFSYGDAMWIY